MLSRYLEQQLASFNPFEYFEEELSGLACLKAVLMPYEAEIESARQSNAMVWQRAGEVCDISISTFIEQVDDNVLAAQERREREDKTMSIAASHGVLSTRCVGRGRFGFLAEAGVAKDC
ncbi:hypothetical protein [Piscirickettsia salmonis]|uniref:hypothetical protein n=1 Tax=Piscirickettsia salmonis TaxID=1238 RepID=UPI00117EAAB9|nr:hypothetical protein [Piscirickettsia salmonis]